jgi:hypothetical protein
VGLASPRDREAHTLAADLCDRLAGEAPSFITRNLYQQAARRERRAMSD